jgi:hypothetical protein
MLASMGGGDPIHFLLINFRCRVIFRFLLNISLVLFTKNMRNTENAEISKKGQQQFAEI